MALLALLASGCVAPIGVRDAGFRSVFAEQTDSVLTSGRLSLANRQTLWTLGLEQEPGPVDAELLAELEQRSATDRRRELYALIAELRYKRASERREQGEFLAAAISAYTYLFCDELGDPPNAYDPRFRLTCDIYNRSLAQAFLDDDGRVILRDSVVETPLGTVTITASRPGFPWGPEEFDHFLPSDRFLVRGLRERVRTSGLGVPLIAIRDGEAAKATEHLGRNVKMAATAVLDVHGGLEALHARRIDAQLELHLSGAVDTVSLNGHEAPLEADLTTPLAFMLQASEIWDHSLTGFLGRESAQFPPGIYLLQPYQEGKIPLVLIHGTASTPAAWAQMLNGLNFYPEVRRKYQIWFAIYNTGTPILYNAADLRDSISKLVHDLDPEGKDPALRRMVLAGHSQGGLLTRLLVSSSGNRLWELVSDTPFESYRMEASARELLKRCAFFEPLPCVERAVFISTPHRGSYVAGGWIGNLTRKLVNLPQKITTAGQELLRVDRLPPELRRGSFTSVDNMKPNSHFVRSLQELPFAPGVTLHSIIAVRGSGPAEKGNDGVVRYSSAHLESASSEFIVRHGHSCQNEPEVISELCRILLEHLADATPAPAPGPAN